MADDVKVTNWPKDGSEARVALDLFIFLRPNLPEKPLGIDRLALGLELFAACRAAASGYSYDLSKIK